MIKAILLDMDDTLLFNPALPFVDAYIEQLIRHIITYHPNLSPEKLHEALFTATHCAVDNFDPLHTNADIFYEQFEMLVNLNREEMQPIIATYMTNDYPKLSNMTSAIDVAVSTVQWLLDQDYAVAIATNPLFERAAIYQRLEWSGLGAFIDSFWFITTMENVHFTKPSAHYYEEILSRLGFEPDEALMVGDSWKNDIYAADRAGLNTFWIQDQYTDTDKRNFDTGLQPDGQGTLNDFYQLITKERWLDTLQPRPLQQYQITPRLTANIAAFKGMVDEIEPHYWHQRPDPNEWSPMEIAVHLRDSERSVQRPRLERILNEDNPFLTSPQTPPEPGTQHLEFVDGISVMLEFAEERRATVALLNNLHEEDWVRPARHSVFGPTNLLEMAAFLARHDRLHINQFCQTVGKCN